MQCMQQYVLYIRYICIFTYSRHSDVRKKTTEYELGVARWLSEWEHKERMMRLHQNAMSNPSMFSGCHAIHFITFFTVTPTQIFGTQFTSYTTYMQDSGFSNSMWYYARPSPSSISFGRFVPFNLWAQTGKLGPNWKRFSSAEAYGWVFKCSLDVLRGASDTLEGEPMAQ